MFRLETLFEKMFNFLLRLLIDKPYFAVVFVVLTAVYLLSKVLKKCSGTGAARTQLRIKFLSIEYESQLLAAGMDRLSKLVVAGRGVINRDVVAFVIDCTALFIVVAQLLTSALFAVSTFMQVSYWTARLCHLMMSHSPPEHQPLPLPPPSLLEVNFILPGLGTGTDSFLEYLPIFAIASLVHEFGHYFASVLSSIRPLAVQFKFAYFVPLTSVQIDGKAYARLPKLRKLGVLTCGIFANFLLCLVLQVCMVAATRLGLYENRGVTVWRIMDEQHPMVSQPGTGVGGLQLNDRIERINGCPTENLANYYRCLHDISVSAPTGICVREPLRFDVDIGPEPEPERQLSLMPFVIDVAPEPPKCPRHSEIYVYNATDRRRRACVHLRRIVRLEQKRRGQSLRYCRHPADCDRGNTSDYCLLADAGYAASAVASGAPNHARFEKFRVFFIEKNSDASKLVIFVGVISDFSHTFFVVQKNALIEFLRKFHEISLSFGFFNLLPCFNFDGYWLLIELIDLLNANAACKIALVRLVSRSTAAFVLLHLAISLWWAEVPKP